MTIRIEAIPGQLETVRLTVPVSPGPPVPMVRLREKEVVRITVPASSATVPMIRVREKEVVRITVPPVSPIGLVHNRQLAVVPEKTLVQEIKAQEGRKSSNNNLEDVSGFPVIFGGLGTVGLTIAAIAGAVPVFAPLIAAAVCASGAGMLWRALSQKKLAQDSIDAAWIKRREIMRKMVIEKLCAEAKSKPLYVGQKCPLTVPGETEKSIVITCIATKLDISEPRNFLTVNFYEKTPPNSSCLVNISHALVPVPWMQQLELSNEDLNGVLIQPLALPAPGDDCKVLLTDALTPKLLAAHQQGQLDIDSAFRCKLESERPVIATVTDIRKTRPKDQKDQLTFVMSFDLCEAADADNDGSYAKGRAFTKLPALTFDLSVPERPSTPLPSPLPNTWDIK